MNMLLLAENIGPETVFVGFGILWLLIIVLAIASLVIWIWALIDAIQNPALDGTMRLVWILVIVFTHFLGAILYLAIARSGKTPGSV
jgi:uncharacterized RDD family membrane protein YckC